MTSTENETETATNTGVEETDEFDEEYEYEDEEYEDEECTEIYHPVPTATRIYVTYEESIDPNEEEEEEEGLTYEDALDQLRELKYPKTRAGPSYVQVPRSNIAVKVYERERFLKLNETTYDINSPHKDQIYHISLNETGDRMALCGGDQTVSVWNRNEDGTWKKVAFWKTHGGAIWRIVWAHPDFGQILATCSFDRNINIFKEDIMEDPEYLKYAYAIRQRRMDKDAVYKQIGKKIDQTRGKLLDEKFDRCWVKIAALRDSRENITDVQFGPRTIGLCLAAVSAAGNLRVYEVPDQRELKHWDLVHETQVIPARLSCVAWSRSKIHRPNVFMGSDEPDSESFYPRVIVYECNEVLREWRRLSSIQFGIAEPVTDIQISPCYRFDGFQFAVAAGDIHVYDFILPPRNFYEDEAPKSSEERNDTERNFDETEFQYQLNKLCHLGDMRKAWRIRYNVQGNVLTASSADGCIRVWKSLFHDQWALLTEFSADDYLQARQNHSIDEDEENV